MPFFTITRKSVTIIDQQHIFLHFKIINIFGINASQKFPYDSSWGQHPHTLLFWLHPCVLYDTLLTEYYSSVPGKI